MGARFCPWNASQPHPCSRAMVYGVEVWLSCSIKGAETRKTLNRVASVLRRYDRKVERVECWDGGVLLVVHPPDSGMASLLIAPDENIPKLLGTPSWRVSQ